MPTNKRAPKKTTKLGDQSQLVEHIANIERLLILALMTQGIEQTQIAVALNVSPSTISRMIPARTIISKKR
jgi:IS30 family transposase